MVELARRIQNPQNKTLKEKTGHLRYKIKLLLTDGISSSGNLKLLRCFKSFFFLLLLMACGVLIPFPRIKSMHSQWKHRVLTTGPPGTSFNSLKHVNSDHLGYVPLLKIN